MPHMSAVYLRLAVGARRPSPTVPTPALLSDGQLGHLSGAAAGLFAGPYLRAPDMLPQSILSMMQRAPVC
jgi:hypothetical protein